MNQSVEKKKPCISHIIYVDDDRFSRRLMEYFFSESNISLVTVASSSSFREELRRVTPDVVLMDSQLGSESGVELALELFNTSPEIPIVFLSSNSYEDIFKNGTPKNVMGLIAKPFSEETLFENIVSLLQNSADLTLPKAEQSNSLRELEKKYRLHLSDQFSDYSKKMLKITVLSTYQMQSLKAEIHKTAGASGLHGFKQLSEAANQLELALESHLEDHSLVNELLDPAEKFLSALRNTIAQAEEVK